MALETVCGDEYGAEEEEEEGKRSRVMVWVEEEVAAGESWLLMRVWRRPGAERKRRRQGRLRVR